MGYGKPKKSAASLLFADTENDRCLSPFEQAQALKVEKQLIKEKDMHEEAARSIIQARPMPPLSNRVINSTTNPTANNSDSLSSNQDSSAPSLNNNTASSSANTGTNKVADLGAGKTTSFARLKEQAEKAKREQKEAFEKQQAEEARKLQEQQNKLEILKQLEDDNIVSETVSSLSTTTVVDDMVEIVPIAGFVVKTFRENSDVKVFINICGHESIPLSTAAIINHYNTRTLEVFSNALYGFIPNAGYVIDERTVGYDILVHSSIVEECAKVVDAEDIRNNPDSIKPLVCDAAIRLISHKYDDMLNTSYKLPKIRSRYKGITAVPPSRKIDKITLGELPPVLPVAEATAQKIRRRSIASESELKEKPPVVIEKQHDPTHADWIPFLHEGEYIVACHPVNKPNPVGLAKNRQLVLTDHCRLYYVDSAKKDLKGEIVWTPQSVPNVYTVSKIVPPYDIYVIHGVGKFVELYLLL